MTGTGEKATGRGGLANRMAEWFGPRGSDEPSWADVGDPEVPFGAPDFLMETLADPEDLPAEAAEALEQAMRGDEPPPSKPQKRLNEAEMFSDSELFLEASLKFLEASEKFLEVGNMLGEIARRRAPGSIREDETVE